MSDSSDEQVDEVADDEVAGDERAGDERVEDERAGDERAGDERVEDEVTDDAGAEDLEALRERVEEEYDFDDFGPADMERMTVEEWEAAFDPETWITGEELLDRVEADLKSRVVQRDVFARVERLDTPDRVVAYSDEGYVVVYPDGSIEGEGAVLRDVKPSVALSSMADYEVPEPPDGDLLPDPMEVPEGSGEFGNLMLQIVAGAQVLAGLGILASPLVVDYDPRVLAIIFLVGLGFLFIGLVLLFTVANARLSDRFRAEEYRNRLRAVGVDSGERPEFLPEHARENPGLDGDDEGVPADGDRRDEA